MSNPAGTKYTVPIAYSPDSEGTLLCVPVSFIPFFRRFFAVMQKEYVWQTRADWYVGYQVFAEMEVQLMSNCIERLIVEIRALRGGSFPAPNWRDPAADPANIGLSTIGGVIIETANVGDKLVTVNTKLDEIKAAIEAENVDLGDIIEKFGQILVLLG
jgi:hypothetical protein